MKKICLLNKGENIKKLEYIFDEKFLNTDIYENELIDNERYLVLSEGREDIVIVKNYNPFFIKKKSGENGIIDYYANGYDVIEDNCSQYLILQKPVGVKYVVKPLEQLESIAQKFGVDVDYIMESNKLKTQKLFVGQVLII